MDKILIADDDSSFVRALASDFRRRRGFEVLEASTGDEVLELAKVHKEDIRCVLLDYSFEKWGGPGQMNGLEIAEKLKGIAPTAEVIMMSEVAGIREVDQAHRIQHIGKFLDKNDSAALLKELERLFSASSPGEHSRDDPRKLLVDCGFYTSSPAMIDLCRDAVDAAYNDLNVLITGETGTGKTELARAIHDLGKAKTGRKGEFMPVNCAAISKELFDSELFGHVRGAFAGAHKDREGLVKAADDGTLFLDEIVEIPLLVQSKLNHAFEPGKGKYRRVGETEELDVFARIIASTNENVSRAITTGRLRHDLYYRFEQIIVIPPLRERPEDIPGLVLMALGGTLKNRDGDNRPTISERLENLIEREALSLLQRQLWIGNVRQLNRVVKRAGRAAQRTGIAKITASHIQRELRIEYGLESLVSSDHSLDLDFARSRYVRQILDQPRGVNEEVRGGIDTVIRGFRKEILIEILKETKGNVAEAARRLGLTKLDYRLKELGIDPEEFRG